MFMALSHFRKALQRVEPKNNTSLKKKRTNCIIAERNTLVDRLNQPNNS